MCALPSLRLSSCFPQLLSPLSLSAPLDPSLTPTRNETQCERRTRHDQCAPQKTMKTNKTTTKHVNKTHPQTDGPTCGTHFLTNGTDGDDFSVSGPQKCGFPFTSWPKPRLATAPRVRRPTCPRSPCASQTSVLLAARHSSQQPGPEREFHENAGATHVSWACKFEFGNCGVLLTLFFYIL